MAVESVEEGEPEEASGGVGSLVDQEEEKHAKAKRGTGGVDGEEAAGASKRKLKPSWAELVRDPQLMESKAFSETVSMQGLAPIFDPNSSFKRKLFWLIVVCGAIVFTAFNIYTQILMYMDSQIVVNVDFQKENDLSFPVVTICNNNFASLKAAESYAATQTLLLIKPLAFALGTNMSKPDFSAYNFTPYHIYGWDSFYYALTPHISDMLLWVREIVNINCTCI
jgi:hypothetical protein